MNRATERLDPRWDRWALVLLIVAAAAPFAQTLGFGYIYDDTTAIRTNPDLRGWGSLFRVWAYPWGGSELPYDGLYRPVVMTLFALLWNLTGGWPLWFHLLAVGMHAAATVMVWRVLQRGVGWLPATFATLWFAVHPVHTEAIASIANISETMVTVLTCALVLHVLRLADQPGPVTWQQGATAGALYLAAFLSKESGAVAPAIAALCVWGWGAGTEPRRLDGGGALVNRWRPVFVGWLVALVAVLTLRAMVLGGPVTGRSIAAVGLDGLSAVERVTAMLSLGPKILTLVFWPSAPNPHYGPTTFPAAGAGSIAAMTVVVIVLAIAGAAALARRGDRRWLVAILWFAIAFLPASNLLVATGQILAERTLYLPTVGAAMFIGLLVLRIPKLFRAEHEWVVTMPIVVAVVSLVIVFFAARSARWSSIWRDHPSLYAQMIRADTAGHVGYWYTGMYVGRNGDMTEALRWVEQAYSRYPNDRDMRLDYSDALLANGHADRALPIVRDLIANGNHRKRNRAIEVYLEALDRTFGADSVAVAARRLNVQVRPAGSPTPRR
jgi:hypothetical protein